MVYFDKILHTYKLNYCLDTGMHSGDKASRSISLAGCGHLHSGNTNVKDRRIPYVMKTSTCFKGSYSLIVSYSRTVLNYFESKSDIHSLLISFNLSR